MEIEHQSGITIKDGDRKIILDPSKQMEKGIVTHGHLDHLVKDALMTPPTLDILEVRKGEKRGKKIHYASAQEIEGFEVTLYPAGHVFGSAMVKVNDVLYTGDFNPHGGRTCKRAAPYECETLIIESTYGKREYSLPPKEEVTKDLKAWTEEHLTHGPVLFGSYEFGKAQELIALLNEMGERPYTTGPIADITEVYNSYDLGLEYEIWDGEVENDPVVVPPGEIKKPVGEIVKEVKRSGGVSSYLSGWCAIYPFYNSMELDAQFPFSDHAGYDSLVNFVEDCDPEKVYTVHGSAEEFAETIERELGIDAEALD